MDNKLLEIQKQLLPKNAKFSESQYNACLVDKSINIVAGPGSGKTTVLIAKIAEILMNNLNAGICILTHTNVAVDEIKLNLKMLGINEIKYPNFIGTINDFCNTFFCRKLFYAIFPEKDMKIVEDREFKKVFSVFFDNIKPDYFTFSVNPLNKDVKIHLGENNNIIVEAKVKESYRGFFEEAFLQTLSTGILTHTHSLLYSKLYVEKYSDTIKEGVINRFSRVYIDEAQDTNELQYDILNLVFNSDKQIVQKYGDPYQAIYNIFEGNKDAWNPTLAMEDNQYVEINETSRFGDKIVDVIKKVCIQEYDTFTSLNIVNSFNPHIIIVNDDEDYQTKVSSLISELENNHAEYRKNKKKDKIVAPYHSNLSDISNYTKPLINGKYQRPIDVVLNYIYLFIKSDINKRDFKNSILDNKSSREIIGDIIVNLLIHEHSDAHEINININKILSNIDTQINMTSDKIKELKAVIESAYLELNGVNNIKNKETLSANNTLSLGTIHSVKGETHRSTFLVGTCKLKEGWDGEEYSLFSILLNNLLEDSGEQKDYYKYGNEKLSIQALKLAYVALSRPQFLTGIIIDDELKAKYENEIEELAKQGWIVYE